MNELIDLTLKNQLFNKNSFELSVVIPVYNEYLNIKDVLSSWDKEFRKKSINYCFVIINDGSKDDSLQLIMSLKYNIFLIDKHNSGHGRSIRLGYDFSINNINVGYILQIDSDGQCDPIYFSKFWKERKKYDFLLGKRKNRGDGYLRKLTSKFSLIATSTITGMNLKDPNTPYRLYNSKTLKHVLSFVNESFDIHNIALTYIIFKQGYKFKTIDINFPDRIGGENSINILRVFQMGLNMIFDLYFLKKNSKK